MNWLDWLHAFFTAPARRSGPDAIGHRIAEHLAFCGEALLWAALLAVPVSDTVKKVGGNQVIESTMPRQGLWLAQTPQVFRRDLLEAAYADRAKFGKDITDDAQLVEAAGHKVHVVESAATNIKITTRADLYLAEAVLKTLPKPKPKGPIHPFAEEEMWGGRPK